MTKTRSAQRRAKRRSEHAKQARNVTRTPPHGQDERTLTLHQAHHVVAAMEAEQGGDLGSALGHVEHLPGSLRHPWSEQLTEMAGVDGDSEPWSWARFTVAAAGRWVRSLQTPLVARVLREVTGNAAGAGGPSVPQSSGWVAGRAALLPGIDGLLLFDEFMIEVFLVQCAPELAVRSGGGRHWAGTPGRVFELIGADGASLTVRDHADGWHTTLRCMGEHEGLSAGALVYGHLVDTPGEPALMFAAPPIVVDEIAAQRLGRFTTGESDELEAWCAAVGAAVRSGASVRSPSPVDDPDVPMTGGLAFLPGPGIHGGS